MTRPRDRIYRYKTPPFLGDLFVTFSQRGLLTVFQELEVSNIEEHRPFGYGQMSSFPPTPGRDSARVVLVDLDFHEKAWEAGKRDSARVDKTVIHESLHVVQDIARRTGADFDPETEAYMLEMIYGHVWDAYQQATKHSRVHKEKHQW